jgi:hypothetical protein
MQMVSTHTVVACLVMLAGTTAAWATPRSLRSGTLKVHRALRRVDDQGPMSRVINTRLRRMFKRTRSARGLVVEPTHPGFATFTGKGIRADLRYSTLKVAFNLEQVSGDRKQIHHIEVLPQGTESSQARVVLRKMVQRGASVRTSAAEFTPINNGAYRLVSGKVVDAKGGYLLGVSRVVNGKKTEKFFLDSGQGQRVAIPWPEYNGLLFHPRFVSARKTRR